MLSCNLLHLNRYLLLLPPLPQRHSLILRRNYGGLRPLPGQCSYRVSCCCGELVRTSSISSIFFDYWFSGVTAMDFFLSNHPLVHLLLHKYR